LEISNEKKSLLCPIFLFSTLFKGLRVRSGLYQTDLSAPSNNISVSGNRTNKTALIRTKGLYIQTAVVLIISFFFSDTRFIFLFYYRVLSAWMNFCFVQFWTPSRVVAVSTHYKSNIDVKSLRPSLFYFHFVFLWSFSSVYTIKEKKIFIDLMKEEWKLPERGLRKALEGLESEDFNGKSFIFLYIYF
jgi:hypothetical protein